MRIRDLWASWAVRSLAANAVGCAADYTVLLTCASVIGLPTRTSAAAGLVVGLTTSFLLNRRYAFRDTTIATGWALLRYAIAMSVLILLHVNALAFLRHELHVPLLVAKVLADAGVMAGGQLLVLRYIVFPRNKSAAQRVRPDRTAELA